MTGIANTIPNLPTASIFVTIEEHRDHRVPVTPANVKQVAGGSTVVAEAVDNVVNSNPFGQNPVVSIPTVSDVSISDNGGTATITISQSTLSQDTTAIQLLFSGTAVNAANDTLPPNSLGGPNYIVTTHGNGATDWTYRINFDLFSSTAARPAPRSPSRDSTTSRSVPIRR